MSLRNSSWRRRPKTAKLSKSEARELIASLNVSEIVLKCPDADGRVRTYEEGQAFYRSQEWKNCRSAFLDGRERVCAACQLDLTMKSPKWLNVDHKLSLRFNWHLRLEQSNLQILCCECNELKGNRVIETADLGAQMALRRAKPEPKAKPADNQRPPDEMRALQKEADKRREAKKLADLEHEKKIDPYREHWSREYKELFGHQARPRTTLDEFLNFKLRQLTK